MVLFGWNQRLVPNTQTRTEYVHISLSIQKVKPENLRFLIQYYADDWLFIDSYTFLIDGNAYTFSNPDVERDNNSMIWEWSDTGVAQSGEVVQILYAIKNAKEVKIRFNGRQYHKDKVLTQKDIKAIQQPIEYFEALGGRF